MGGGDGGGAGGDAGEGGRGGKGDGSSGGGESGGDGGGASTASNVRAGTLRLWMVTPSAAVSEEGVADISMPCTLAATVWFGMMRRAAIAMLAAVTLTDASSASGKRPRSAEWKVTTSNETKSAAAVNVTLTTGLYPPPGAAGGGAAGGRGSGGGGLLTSSTTIRALMATNRSSAAPAKQQRMRRHNWLLCHLTGVRAERTDGGMGGLQRSVPFTCERSFSMT